MARGDLPGGTVTFLFSDVEGSTRLLESLGAEAYGEVLARHRAIVRDAVAENGGVEVDTQGDAFFVVFVDATRAAEAATRIHEGLKAAGLRVRIGLHTGVALVTDEGYVGDAVHLGARIGAAAHGGQTVVSGVTRSLLARHIVVTDLGEHRLKDIPAPVPLAQLGRDPFPPLRTLAASSLPVPLADIIGRAADIEAVRARIDAGARLVTILGAGGIGKTRMAIEAARALAPRFPAGSWWVDLAPIRDPELVAGTIAVALGAGDDLAGHIRDRRMLLVLDNLEQLVGVAPIVRGLLASCSSLVILATSRTALALPGEAEVRLGPLDADDAVALFRARSGIGDDPLVPELVRRLDALPLAIELAAARARLLGVRAILDRLGSRLDILRSTRADDGRHAALRATIAWSDELLAADARRLFGRLSLFAGGWTLEAAEAVVGGGIGFLDDLEALIDHSLVRRTDSRFSMLETIRAYATERFDVDPDRQQTEDAFLRWALDLLEAQDARIRGRHQVAALAILDAEIANLRAAWDIAARSDTPDVARRFARAAGWWLHRRGFAKDAMAWAQVALGRPGKDRGLLGWTILDAVSIDFAALSTPAGLASLAEVEAIGRETGDERLIGIALESRGLVTPGREGAALLAEAIARFEALGMDNERARATINAAAQALNDGDLPRAIELGRDAAALARLLGNQHGLAVALGNVAGALVLDGQVDAAEPIARDIVEASQAVADEFGWIAVGEIVAPILAARGQLVAAAELVGFVDAGYERLGYGREPSAERLREAACGPIARLAPPDRKAALARGRAAAPERLFEGWLGSTA